MHLHPVVGRFRSLFTLLPLAALLTPLTWAGTPGTPQSGTYGGDLILAKHPTTGEITGYYENESGNGQFTCIFALRGKSTGTSTEIEIETYFPDSPKETIKGKLKVADLQTLQIGLKEEHGGCWNVQHFADAGRPVEFSLGKLYPQWRSIAVIREKKVPLFNSPKDRAPRKAYLVRGNGVGIVEEQSEWLKIEYPSSKKLIGGWVPRSAFYP